jgi:phosphate-selective porin OprO/OprP
MFIKSLLCLFFSIFMGNLFAKTPSQPSLNTVFLSDEKHQKISIFAKPVYKKEKSHSFKYESADEKYGLYIMGLIAGHADSFFNSQGLIMNMGTNAIELVNMNNITRTWLLAVSPIIESKLDDHIHLYFNPDFGQDQYRVFDASVDINYLKTFSITAGLQKSLISGFEPSVFNYTGFTSSMSPWREITLQLYGELGPTLFVPYNVQHDLGLNSFFFYELAMTNGAPDGAFPGLIPFAVNGEDDLYQVANFNISNKAFEARFFMNPFIEFDQHPLQHFGLGFSGSAMTAVNQKGLPAILSIGRNVIYQFNALEETFSIAQGRRNRFHPQFIWYHKNFAILGDYIVSTQQLSNYFNSNVKEYPTIRQINRTGQALVIWNLTGEDYSWSELYEPQNNFRPLDRVGTGAFQLGFRFSAINFDPSVFDYSYVNDQGQTKYNYSDPRTSVQKASAYGVVLNWIWNKSFKLSTEFSYTQFKGGCSTGALSSPINPGCLTAPNVYIAQPGSTVIDRPAEMVLFQQATILF